MKIRYICLIVGSVLFGISCLAVSLAFMTMSEDLIEKVESLEMENDLLRWENENNYTYCISGEEVFENVIA